MRNIKAMKLLPEVFQGQDNLTEPIPRQARFNCFAFPKLVAILRQNTVYYVI